MLDPTPPALAPLRIETQVERVLLAGVPTAQQAELLPLLRSPDRSVREVALVLIQLDREAAARHLRRWGAQRVPPARRPRHG